MRAITSRTEVLKKLKKNNLLHHAGMYYLSDFHHTKIGKSIAEKLISEKKLEPTKAVGHWFEDEWRLMRPVNKYRGVDIFKDSQNNNYFFYVPKGEYVMASYKYCVEKIDYLINIGEKVK